MVTTNTADATLFLTVADEKYCNHAEKARELHNKLCLPSNKDFIFNIETRTINDLGSTQRNIHTRSKILRPNEFSCKR